MVRPYVALLMVALVVAGCNHPGVTPTNASETPPPTRFGALSCAPPAGMRVHTVPVPGASPLSLWIADVSPARGATVRAGEFYQIQSVSNVPPGVTAVLQTFVSDTATAAGGFASANMGGCGRGGVGMAIPRSTRELRLYVRVWIRPGALPLPEIETVFRSPPDYEASEALNWTIAP